MNDSDRNDRQAEDIAEVSGLNIKKTPRARGPNTYNKLLNPVTLAHQCALLLSTHTIFFKLAWALAKIGDPDKDVLAMGRLRTKALHEWNNWSSKSHFESVFRFGLDGVKTFAVTGDISNDFSALIVKGANHHLQTAKARFEEFTAEIRNAIGVEDVSELDKHELSLNDIAAVILEEKTVTQNGDNINDVVNVNVGQSAVWRLADKLGLTVAQTYQAIEVFHNMMPKENCGHFFHRERAEGIQHSAQGVYAILTPTIVSRPTKIRLLTLRIADAYSTAQLSVEQQANQPELAVVRAKLNMPNTHDSRFNKYQYRGYLVDTNTVGEQMANWSIQLNQAPKSVDTEKYLFDSGYGYNVSSEDKAISFEVNQADDMHINIHSPSPDTTFTGILSSLSQRRSASDKHPHNRYPYSALLIGVKLFDGNYSEAEQAFMQQAFGVYQNVDILAEEVQKRVFKASEDKSESNVQQSEVMMRLRAACESYSNMIDREKNLAVLKVLSEY